VADVPRLTGLPDADARELTRSLVDAGDAEPIDRWLVPTPVADDLRARATSLVQAHHRDRPLERGIEPAPLAAALRLDAGRLRALLEADPDLVVEQGVVRHGSHVADATESPEARKLLDALEASPFSPPAPADVGASPGLVRTLTRDGLLTDLDGVVFATSALARARDLVVGALRDRGTLTVADVRDVLGSTRKYVVPIVTWLDRTGVTRRRGDDRVAGPTSGLA
jgi:selenocysteine-specific elongation factor